jgi:lambda family phage portal protein
MKKQKQQLTQRQKDERRIVRRRRQQRAFEAAQASRFTSNWLTGALNANDEIKYSLEPLRARARDLTQNDAIAIRYIRLLIDNVPGHKGIDMRPKIRKADGTLDTAANKKLKTAWEKWGRSVTQDGMSWKRYQKTFIETAARDGEVFTHFIRSRAKGLQLKLIDSAHLDAQHDDILKGGNLIYSSVEVNEGGTPVAYWPWKRYPGDRLINQNERIRIPVSDAVLCFRQTYPFQVRGYSWLSNVMNDLKQAKEYNFTELVSARVASLKGVYFTRPDGVGENEEEDEEEDEDEHIQRPLEPGGADSLPAGWDVKQVDPKHPTQEFSKFVTKILQRIASGLSVSYHSVASDLGEHDFSSLRAGSLLDRDTYRGIQSWMIESFCDRIYREWVNFEMLRGKLDIPKSKQDQLYEVTWHPRGWSYVNPQQELQAIELMLNNTLDSKSNVVAERGRDYEEILAERKADRELEELYGESLTNKEVAKEAVKNSDEDK